MLVNFKRYVKRQLIQYREQLRTFILTTYINATVNVDEGGAALPKHGVQSRRGPSFI